MSLIKKCGFQHVDSSDELGVLSQCCQVRGLIYSRHVSYQVVWTLTSRYLTSLSYTVKEMGACVIWGFSVHFALWDIISKTVFNVILYFSEAVSHYDMVKCVICFILWLLKHLWAWGKCKWHDHLQLHVCVCFCATLWNSCEGKHGAHTSYECLSLVGCTKFVFLIFQFWWIIRTVNNSCKGRFSVLVAICFADTCWCLRNKSN